MLKAKQILYKIGKIVNIVLIVLAALSVAGVALGVLGSFISEWYNDGFLPALISSFIGIIVGEVVPVICLAANIATYIVLKKVLAAQTPADKLKMSIVMIVLGVFAENWLYVVAAVFGIILRNQDEPMEELPAEETEEPAEETEEPAEEIEQE